MVNLFGYSIKFVVTQKPKPVRKDRKIKVSDKTIKMVQTYRQNGWKLDEVVKKLGIGRTTLLYWWNPDHAAKRLYGKTYKTDYKAREKAKIKRDTNRLEIMRKRHVQKLPLVHFDDCPACFPNSVSSYESYVRKVRREVLERAKKANPYYPKSEKAISVDVKPDTDKAHVTEEGLLAVMPEEEKPPKDFTIHDRTEKIDDSRTASKTRIPLTEDMYK